MREFRLACLLFATLLSLACRAPAGDDYVAEPWAGKTFTSLPKRIAFGSCMGQNEPKPVLDLARESKPDLFVFLGDNIYSDTFDAEVLRANYAVLATAPEFVRLKAAVPLIATWDDHDYGHNDTGETYPLKAASRELFLDFWDEPADSPRRKHDGIYTSYTYEEHGRILQILVLDERWWRSELGLMFPQNDPKLTMLGAEQWAWLEGELEKPADVRIVASSSQFSHSWNGYESWTNMPLEKQKMLDLIAKTRASGVVFISGDVHWAEMSKEPVAAPGYDVWDVTSSGITEEWANISTNEHRVGPAVAENNYGYIDIDWTQRDAELTFGIVDVNGKLRNEQKVRLSALRFR